MQPGPGQPPPGAPRHDRAVQPVERPVRGRLLLLPRLLHAGAGERGRRWDRTGCPVLGAEPPRCRRAAARVGRAAGAVGGKADGGSPATHPPRDVLTPECSAGERGSLSGEPCGAPAHTKPVRAARRPRSTRRQRVWGEPSTGSGAELGALAAKATTSPQTSALTGRKVSAGSPHLQDTS